ncbi:Dabb family protein [Mucilaginibacter sp.]
MILQNTLVHHVHIWLKDRADKQKLMDGLSTLKAITHIRDIHIGVPLVDGDDSYDASLLILFNNQIELDAYNIDPIHVAFVENIAKSLCAKVTVTDSVNV